LNKRKNPVLFEQIFLAYARYIFQPYKTAPAKTKEDIRDKKFQSRLPTTHITHPASTGTGLRTVSD
jgi:hypothetical protein